MNNFHWARSTLYDELPGEKNSKGFFISQERAMTADKKRGVVHENRILISQRMIEKDEDKNKTSEYEAILNFFCDTIYS